MLFDRLFRTRSAHQQPAPLESGKSVKSSRRGRRHHAHRRGFAGQMELLEPRQLLAMMYQGITYTCTSSSEESYMYNFLIYQDPPGTDPQTTMYMRHTDTLDSIEFDYDTDFSGVQIFGSGISTSGTPWFHGPNPFTPGFTPYPTAFEGPGRLWASNTINTDWCVPDQDENYTLTKVRIVAAPGTVDPTFVLHAGDSFPLALEVDFSQAAGTSRIYINSAAAHAFPTAANGTTGGLVDTPFIGGGGNYSFLASEVYVRGPLDPRAFRNDFRATSLVQIENQVQNRVDSLVSDGNFVLFPGASINGSVDVRLGDGVPASLTSPYRTYGYGGNGGDIIINGDIVNAGTVYLQTTSVDPRSIRTGPGGLISGGGSVTLYNSAADGSLIDVRTSGFSQHNIFAGSAINPEADIEINVTHVGGNLTINALPSTRSALRLTTTAAGSQIITNTNIDTYGSLVLSAPALAVNVPISTRFGDIQLNGQSVTIGSNVTPGRDGVGNLTVNATAGNIVVQSAASLQASGQTVSLSASGNIVSEATLIAERLEADAGASISANSRVISASLSAGGSITIADESDIAIEQLQTLGNGSVVVSAKGMLEVYDVATGGVGDVTFTTTQAGLLARDIDVFDGTLSLSIDDGDITAIGDVFVNDPSGADNDFLLASGRGNIVMSPGATFTVADQLSFSAPLGRVLTPGEITALDITEAGSGYVTPPSVSLQSGQGAGFSPTIGDSQVTFVRVLNGGSGYTAAPLVHFDNTDTGGTGATALAEISNGVVVAVRITNGGVNYTSAPAVTFSGGGGGGGAAAIASISGITALSPVSGGAGYQVPPTVVISSGTGSTSSAISVDANGSILGINLSQSGGSFVGSPTVTITDQSGTGAGAAAVATLSPGVTGAFVTLGGSGYAGNTTVSVDLPPSGGTPATGRVELGLTNASIIQPTPLVGTGTGYREGDLLEVVAGTGAQFAVATAPTGTVTGVTMLSAGRNYSVGDVLYLDDASLGATGLQVQVNSIRADGVIDSNGFTILSGGSGYTTNTVLTHVGGTGAVLRVAETTNPGGAGSITKLEVWDSNGAGLRKGSGYTTKPSGVVGGSGFGAEVLFNDTEYTVVNYVAIEPGTGYSVAPKITLSPPSGTDVASVLPVVSNTVSGISVTNAGTGYNPAETIVTVTAAAQGGGASSQAVSVNGLGGITGINVAMPGYGYVAPPTVTIVDESGTGTGARASAKLSEGVTEIVLTSSGAGYTSAPKVTITGVGGIGGGAEAEAFISAEGYVTSVRIITPGSGYTNGATAVFSGGGGTTQATATLSTSAVVDSISIESTGVGYDPARTTVTFTPVGEGAQAVANITNGQVTSLRLLDNGAGYSSATPPTVRLIPFGTGALATSTIDGSGAVDSVVVTAPGSNYAVSPVVAFSAPPAGGTQAEGVAVVDNVAQLSAARLNWQALEKPLDALLDQFAVARLELTGDGDLNVTRSSGELVLEGAVTKNGSIAIAAQKLTVAGPVIAGDFDTTRTETVTLEAVGNDLLIDASITAPLSVTLLANAGEITATSLAARGLVSSQSLIVSALDGINVRSAVDAARGVATGTGAAIVLDETDSITIGGTSGPLATNNGTITVTADGVLTAGTVDAGSTGAVSLTAKSNLLAAAGVAAPNVIANMATLSSTSGRVELSTQVDTLTAASPLVTVDITNSGGNLLSLASVSARGNVTVHADASVTATNVSSALGNVDIELTSGDILVDTINADRGVITLVAPGAVTWVDPLGVLPNLTATTGRISAGSAVNLRTAVGTLAAVAPDTITVVETDDISLGDLAGPVGFRRVESATDDVNVTAAGAITAVDVRAPAGNVSLESTGAGILTGLVSVDTTAGTIRLSALNSITDNDSTLDLTGYQGVFSSSNGTIGAQTDPIETSLAELSATAQGNIYVSNNRNLITRNLESAGGNISVTAAGTILLDEQRSASVASVTVLDGGSGYLSAPTVTFSDPDEPNGVLAQGTAILAFPVGATTIVSGGSGYTTTPNVVFSAPEAPNGRLAQGFATLTNGQVTQITITDPGTGYFTAPSITFDAPLTGTTATAISTLANAGEVAVIALTDAGSGYLTPPTVTIDPPLAGTTAIALANLTNNPANRSVQSAEVTYAGSGYDTIPTVTFSAPTAPGGQAAEGVATVNFGVGSVSIDDGGSGYVTTPLVTFSNPTDPSGTLARGVAVLVAGEVVQVTITDPGSGYTSTPTVTISPSPTGNTAAGTVNLSGEVTGITLTYPGSGYVTPPTVTIESSPTGDDATAKATLDIGSVTAYASVNSVAIRIAGSGYATAPAVTFSAPDVAGGRTATGTATVDVLGRVSGVTITDPGSGYLTTPTITFAASPGGVTAQGDVVLGGGTVFLQSAGNITQNVPIKSIGVNATASAGTIVLANAENDTKRLAMSNPGRTVQFVDTNHVTIAGTGITASDALGGNAIDVLAETITVEAPVVAGSPGTANDGNILLTATKGDIGVAANLTAEQDTITLRADAGTIVQTGGVIDSRILVWYAQSQPTLLNTNTFSVVGPNLTSPGDMRIPTFGTQAGTLTIAAASTVDGSIIVDADSVVLIDVMTAGGAGHDVSVTAQAGDIIFQDAGRIENAQGNVSLSATSGAVTATNTATWTTVAAGSVIGGGLQVTAQDTSTLLTDVASVNATVSGGDLNLSAVAGLALAGVDATNIDLNAVGDITQSGAITGVALNAVSTNGAVTLTHVTNDVDSLQGSAGPNAFAFTDSDDLLITGGGVVGGHQNGGTGVGISAGSLDISAPITAGAAGSGNGNIYLTATSGGIAINADLTALADRITLDARNGIISQAPGTSLDCLILVWYAQQAPNFDTTATIEGPNLTSPGDIVITRPGPLVLAGASTVDGAISISASDVTIIDLVNVGGVGNAATIAATSGNINFIEAGRVENSGGNINLVAVSGAITATNTASWTTLTAGGLSGGQVELFARDSSALSTDVTSFYGTVSNGNLTLSGPSDLTVARISATDIAITAAGDILQTGPITGRSLTVGSTAGTVSLTNSGNDVDSVAIANAGRGVSFTDADAVDIATAGIQGGTVAIVAAGLTQTGSITGSTLAVTNTAGAVTLDNQANNVAAVSIANAGRPVAYTDATSVAVANAGIQGSTIALQAGGLSQTGSITGTSLSVTNTSGSVALANASNDVANVEISNSARSVAYTDANAVNIDDAGIQGSSIVLTAGGITQTGAVTGGSLSVTNSSGGVALTNISNDVDSVAISNPGRTAAFTDTDGFSVSQAGITAATVRLQSGGNLQQAGAINATVLAIGNELVAGTVSGDFNGDGISDLAGRDAEGRWWVGLANDANTNLSYSIFGIWNPTATWLDVMAADVNGDGLDDVVSRTSGGIWWGAISNGTSFTNQRMGAQQWAPIAWQDVMTGDYNGDGRDDVIGRAPSGAWWAGISVPGTTGPEFRNRYMGSWNPNAGWQDVMTADFTGDGTSDIVGRTSSGYWWLGVPNATGTAISNRRMGQWSPIEWVDVNTGDFNGDGRADVAGRTLTGQWWTALTNLSATAFNSSRWGEWSPTINWTNAMVGDYNNDGLDDIAGQVDYGSTWWSANSTGSSFVNQRRNWTTSSVWGSGSVFNEFGSSFTAAGSFGGTVNLTSASNDVDQLAMNSNGRDAAFRDLDGLSVGVGSLGIQGGDVTLTTGAALTQTQPILATALSANVSGGVATLGNTGNDFGVLSANLTQNGAALTVAHNGDLAINQVSARGDVTISTTNGGNLLIGPPVTPTPLLQTTTKVNLGGLTGDLQFANGGQIIAPGGVNLPPGARAQWVVTRPQAPTGEGSLLATMEGINAAGIPAEIVLPANTTIQLTAALPAMTTSFTLQANNLILDGSLLGVGSRGMSILATASSSIVSGVTFRNFQGVGLDLVGTTNTLVSGNTFLNSGVGLQATGVLTGTQVLGNQFSGNPTGISLTTAQGLRVGSSTAASRNTVSNASREAVFATGLCTGSVIQGMIFGANVARDYNVSASRNLTIVP